MNKICAVIIIICISLIISACQPGQILGPTFTPTSTITLTPTPTFTQTPTPTLTPTQTPTQTPTPTLTPTPLPTATPIGGSSGKIVFAREELLGNDNTTWNIFLLDLSANIETKLTNNTDPKITYFKPVFSPDGKRIAYQRANRSKPSEIFTMDIDGKNVRKVSPSPHYQGNIRVDELLVDYFPAWSPDGSKIVFASNRHLLHQYYFDAEIYIIDLSTFEVEQLTNAYRDSLHPWFSPDGTKITFMSNREDNWNIYIMDYDGKNVQKITTGFSSDRFPKWSNDGEYIIFHSDRDGSIDLYLYNVEDKSIEKITNDPSINSSASFSPDNEWIVFQSDTTGPINLYLRNLQSGEVIQLTSGSTDEGVADWSR